MTLSETAIDLCVRRDKLVLSAVDLVETIKRSLGTLTSDDPSTETYRQRIEQLQVAVQSLGNVCIGAVQATTERALATLAEHSNPSKMIH